MSLSIKTQKLVSRALKAMESEAPMYSDGFTTASAAIDYCSMKLSHCDSERFMVLFLNSQNELIISEIMFNGTIDAASVYPREVIKRALELNAKNLIISHNHPSGKAEPSQADKNITKRLQDGCRLFDISILDHIIVAGNDSLSFAQRGLI
jgi:DNA repair protein RadC